MYKRLLSLILVGLMIFGVLAPVSVLAKEDKTTVVIHKMDITGLSAEDKAKFPGQEGIDGTKYTGDEVGTGYFGTAELLSGVVFTYWKVTEEQYNTMSASSIDYKTVDKVNALLNDPSNTGADTGETVKGKVEVTDLEDGFYWFVENKAKSNIADNKELNEEIAVPFGLALPIYYESGRFNNTTKKLHVYPKNTLEEPTVQKDVTEIGNKVDSFDFEEVHKWIITVDIPEDIAEYKVFKVSDTLDKALTYVGIESVDVIESRANGTSLKNLMTTPDYTLTEPPTTKPQPDAADGGTLTIDFKDHIDALAEHGGKVVKIVFKAKINDNAVMGTAIPNDVNFVFGHNPDHKKEKNPEDKPRVYTGGKRFIKRKENSDPVVNLQGAKFEVLNKDKTHKLYYKEGNETEYKWFKVDGSEATTGYKVKELISGPDGSFEINGLAYGGITKGVTPDKDVILPATYYLKETVAPSGYALLTELIEFTVDANSHKTDLTWSPGGKLEGHTDANQLIVNNKPITIPQTGGIGTIIFTVLGLSIMAVALLSLRKRKTTEKY